MGGRLRALTREPQLEEWAEQAAHLAAKGMGREREGGECCGWALSPQPPC